MYEHRRMRPLPRRLFVLRMAGHFAVAALLVALSLFAGMWGYEHYEHLGWRDAFLNAAMLLGGMGPIKQELSEPGKVFAGLYALYAGLVVIALTGLLLAPGIHHLMHQIHWEAPKGGA